MCWEARPRISSSYFWKQPLVAIYWLVFVLFLPFDLIKAGATQTETSLLKQYVASECVDLLDDYDFPTRTMTGTICIFHFAALTTNTHGVGCRNRREGSSDTSHAYGVILYIIFIQIHDNKKSSELRCQCLWTYFVAADRSTTTEKAWRQGAEVFHAETCAGHASLIMTSLKEM